MWNITSSVYLNKYRELSLVGEIGRLDDVETQAVLRSSWRERNPFTCRKGPNWSSLNARRPRTSGIAYVNVPFDVLVDGLWLFPSEFPRRWFGVWYAIKRVDTVKLVSKQFKGNSSVRLLAVRFRYMFPYTLHNQGQVPEYQHSGFALCQLGTGSIRHLA